MRAFITSLTAALLISTSALAAAPKTFTLHVYGYVVQTKAQVEEPWPDKFTSRAECKEAAREFGESMKPRNGILVLSNGTTIQLTGYQCIPDGWTT